MIIKNLPGYYYITNIQEHNSIKNNLLSLMDILPVDNNEHREEDIERTDWNLHEFYNREYLELFYNIITPYMENMCRTLLSTKWEISNAWFQQYQKTNLHDWHIHGCCMYANVYFLELPKSELVTQLYDVHTKNIISLEDVKEGDLITFPSNMIHRSPQNQTNYRKTIISFNSNFYDTDEKRVNQALFSGF